MRRFPAGRDFITEEEIRQLVARLEECGKAKDLGAARRLHRGLVERGHAHKMFLANHILNMYAKCGSMDEAESTFDQMQSRNIVSWNTMIAAYAQRGSTGDAFRLFSRMQQTGVAPSSITLSSLLIACAGPECLARARVVHSMAVELGLEAHPVVGTALVGVYSRAGLVQDAERAFSKLRHRDIIAWTSMVSVYAQCGQAEAALATFRSIDLEGLRPNVVTFVAAVHACRVLSLLGEGRLIHGRIVERGFHGDLILVTALVDMYGKCGSLVEAQRLFDGMNQRDDVAWTALLEAYAQHGQPGTGLKLFKRMQQEGMKPSSWTFTAVLQACGHGGMVQEARLHFLSMLTDHQRQPSQQHCNVMVDVLGRGGELLEAEEFMSRMPFKPEPVAWTTLLSACRKYGDVKRGERVADRVFQAEPHSPQVYVLLAQLYTEAGLPHKASALRRAMEEKWGHGSSSWIADDGGQRKLREQRRPLLLAASA